MRDAAAQMQPHERTHPIAVTSTLERGSSRETIRRSWSMVQ